MERPAPFPPGEDSCPSTNEAPAHRPENAYPNRSPIMSNVTSTTVQADIARAGREMLNRFPIGTTLVRPDLTGLLSNLSLSDPHLTDDADLLMPFQPSISMIDRGLVQSADLAWSSSASSSPIPQPLSVNEMDWVRRQLGSVGRLIEQHSTQAIVFRDLPYNPPVPCTTPAADQPERFGPASVHASLLKTPTPSPLSDVPIATADRLGATDSAGAKSFYQDFVMRLFQQWLNQSRQPSHPSRPNYQQPNQPGQQPQSQPHPNLQNQPHHPQGQEPKPPPQHQHHQHQHQQPQPQQPQPQNQSHYPQGQQPEGTQAQQHLQLLEKQGHHGQQDKQSHPSPAAKPHQLPLAPFVLAGPPTDSISLEHQDCERSATASPDPLAMNLATRSAHRARPKNLLTTEDSQLSTPLLKKKRPNPPSSPWVNKQPNLIHPPSSTPSITKSSAAVLSSSPIKPVSTPVPIKHAHQSQGLTNNTPNLAPSERFVALLEDILEADDMAVPAEYFYQLHSQFVLTAPILSNIKALLDQSNGQAIENTPVTDMARLIKILERGVKIVEDLNVLPTELKQKIARNRLPHSRSSIDDRPPSSKKSGSKKSGMSANRLPKPSSKKSLSSARDCGGDSMHDTSNDESDDEVEYIGTIEERLKILSMALHSIDATLALLAFNQFLPKQFYSEDLIKSLLNCTKNQLSNAIFPFVEAGEKGNLDAYSKRLRRIISTSKIIPTHVTHIFAFFSTAILPKIDLLVRQIDLSESIVINVSYIAIAPFFVDCGPMTDLPSVNTKSKKSYQVNGSMKAMRLECLKLLRNISSKYPDQRSWIVEEILNSILNLQEHSIRGNKAVYYLANGKSIQIFSALLLHIVQCCLSKTRERVGTILCSPEPSSLDALNPEFKTGTSPPSPMPPKPEIASAFRAIQELIEPELFTATKLSKKIISFLLQKSGKSSKSTHEVHYKMVLDRLVEDLINVLFLPDWPVAEFMLGLFCKTMMGLLDSNKANADTNAIKSMCLDYLGPITAKLVEPIQYPIDQSPKNFFPSLSFKAMIKSLDQKSISSLLKLQKTVVTCLDTGNNSGDLSNTAADFLCGQWMCDMINASKGLQASLCQSLENPVVKQEMDDEARKEILKEEAFLAHLNSCIEDLGSMQVTRTISTLNRHCSDEFSLAVNNGPVNEILSKIQGLKGMADIFLERILATSASPSVTFRSKAIKALALVVAKDETVFLQELVRKGIENRMLDSSPAVRDAAVELVGKYVASRPDLAVAYLPQISARVADKGVSVRRRVVKLLKAIYLILDGELWVDLKVDISHRLISRIHDEEAPIKDLAMSVINELWFSQTTHSTFNTSLASLVLMKVSAAYKESPSPVEVVIKLIIKQHDKQNELIRQQFRQRCKDIIEHLIDQLMDVASTARDPAFSEVECVRTICALTYASPQLLEANKAMMLLPYLKGATTSSENVMVQYLLKIFRSCVISLPKSSSAFGERLQSTLLVLVNKPSLNGGGAILQELIACFCAVIIHQTGAYDQLLNVFKACEQRLRIEKKKMDEDCSATNLKSLPILMYLVGTLVAYGQFNQLPAGQERVQEALKSISQDPMHVHAHKLILDIYHAEPCRKIRSITVTCLGFLYQSFPSLMTRSESINLMDSIFDDHRDSDLQHRLLKLIVECITQQIERSGVDEEQGTKEVDVNQLIGRIDGSSDSGVPSAIVQRYFAQITTLAQSTKAYIQKAAVDIISFTIKQGLTHPLECVPILVALESSGDVALSKQVFALHMLLHTQRGNLVHCRFLETMNKVFDYHSKASGTDSFATGYAVNPIRSVVASWYTLLSEKRAWRLSFSKALIKSFSIDPQTDIVDERTIGLQRYLAEALVTLELKTEEEAMVLIDSLNRSVGQSAYQTLHLLDGDPLKALLSRTLTQTEGNGNEEPKSSSVRLGFNSSIVLGIGFVLRDLLKKVYGISDHKLSKFTMGAEKKGDASKSFREKLINRTLNVKETVELFDAELRKKVPGLDVRTEKAERFKKQLDAFGDLVKNDCEVLEKDTTIEMIDDEEENYHSPEREDDMDVA